MKLHTIVPENHVIIGLEALSLEEAISSLLDCLSDDILEPISKEAIRLTLQRENERPTIITSGVAVPHARVEGLEDPALIMGISHDSIPSPVEDKDPLNFIVLLLAPPTKNTFMLQMMSAVARLFSSEERRSAMLRIKTPQRLVQYLKETEINVKKTLTVEDVMLSTFNTLSPDQTLDQAAEILSKSDLTVLPVVDEKGMLMGNLSIESLIHLALPDYIGLISNQNFLESFDPFENYFMKERKRLVSEVMNLKCAMVKPETSILEVGQILCEKPGRQVYVCRNKKVIGVINASLYVNHCLLL